MKKVIIVEDEDGLREGLRILLNRVENITVVADFDNAEDCITFLKDNIVDVVLMDITLNSKLNGIEATQIIKEKYSLIHVIILTILEQSTNVFKALTAGATGYLVKTDSAIKIAEAIHEVCNGGSPMTPSIARKIVKSFFKPKLDVNFTNREKEVLQLLKQGFSYKHIASELFVAVSTVKYHLQNIYIKLQVNNKQEALVKLKDTSL